MEKRKNQKNILKGIGSVLLALFASSHHWLHTLLIALGLTSLGTLLDLPPYVRVLFLLVSIIFSVWFIFIARRKWKQDRPAAWVYLVSSIISIILVLTAIPQTIALFDQPAQQQRQQQSQPAIPTEQPPQQQSQPPQQSEQPQQQQSQLPQQSEQPQQQQSQPPQQPGQVQPPQPATDQDHEKHHRT